MLNGHYFCIKGYENSMTINKIYKFSNGICIRDSGRNSYPRYETVDDYNDYNRSKIKEIKTNVKRW